MSEPKTSRASLLAASIVALLLLAALGFVALRILDRLETIERRVESLTAESSESRAASERALERAIEAEGAARAAAEGRLSAEAEKQRAQESEALAHGEAEAARMEVDSARAEAEEIRRHAEAEMTRLEEALSKIAETRRTALGLVMNLGEDHLKFDFDKSDLKPENRELLSRIAGILLTSSDYTVSVNGHTDDVGSEEYNQKLSERRADAVRNYLIEAGVPETMLSVQGWGKSKPLVPGRSEEARAKNRRVELGIVNTRISYRGAPLSKSDEKR